MTFTSSLIKRFKLGRNIIHFGSYTMTAATTGGDIDTGLGRCDFLFPWQMKGAAIATEVAVNEDFSAGPIPGNAITIIAEAAGDGYWIAVGR